MDISSLIPFIKIIVTIGIGTILGHILSNNNYLYQTLNKVSVFITFPILIFQSLLLSKINISGIINPLLIFSFISMITLILGLIIRQHLVEKQKGNSWLICLNFGNIAFIGLPLISSLYPQTPFIPIFVALTLLIVFGLISPIIQSKNHWYQSILTPIKSPLFLASLLGVTFNIFNVSLPNIVHSLLSPISFSATYIALLAIGLFLGTQNISKVYFKAGLNLTLVKTIALPLLTLSFYPFFTSDTVYFKSLVLFFALPIAITPFSMTSNYPIEKNLTSSSIVLSTILSMISLPLIYLLLETLF